MKWIANLSNGEVITSESNLPGNKSQWQLLLGLLREKNLAISSLQLTHTNIVISALPAKLCDGYFQGKQIAKYVFRGEQKEQQGIGSVIGDQVYITWIRLSQGNVYITNEVMNLSEVKIHTTVR